MSADEDRRALQRFVAGVDVEADALATAITAQALDHVIVDEALLHGLSSDDAVVRRRTARRIARMVDVGDAVAGRLAILAETDPDEPTREAAAIALRAHDRLPEVDVRPERRRPRRLAVLSFVPAQLRSTGSVGFKPTEPPGGGLITSARLDDAEGVVRMRFEELPAEFAGTLPAVVAIDDAGVETELARASTAVTPEGAVTIALPAELGAIDAVRARLKAFELIVPER